MFPDPSHPGVGQLEIKLFMLIALEELMKKVHVMV